MFHVGSLYGKRHRCGFNTQAGAVDVAERGKKKTSSSAVFESLLDGLHHFISQARRKGEVFRSFLFDFAKDGYTYTSTSEETLFSFCSPWAKHDVAKGMEGVESAERDVGRVGQRNPALRG